MANYLTQFLLTNLALAFYLVGCIWADEVDIFRSWQMLDAANFRRVQTVHWRKLPYRVFLPSASALSDSLVLIWYHPASSPAWGIWCNLACQLASHVLTALFWGRWQAKLSHDNADGNGVYLALILNTDWVRTLLISAYGAILLGSTIQVVR